MDRFGIGSLVVVPVIARPGPDNPDNDPFFEVMSPIIRSFITTADRAMTVFPCVQELGDMGVPQNPVNLPAGLTKPGDHSEIVGLYANGLEYSCGIFHPTGKCIMRKEYTQDRKETLSFCPVCRYALVDQIDPIQHKMIERDYNGRYPTLKDEGMSTLTKILIVAAIVAVIGVVIRKWDEIMNKLEEEF